MSRISFRHNWQRISLIYRSVRICHIFLNFILLFCLNNQSARLGSTKAQSWTRESAATSEEFACTFPWQRTGSSALRRRRFVDDPWGNWCSYQALTSDDDGSDQVCRCLCLRSWWAHPRSFSRKVFRKFVASTEAEKGIYYWSRRINAKLG